MNRRVRHTQDGFTLIEAMIAISVLAILLAIAVPSFKDASLGSQLRASATDLAASAYLARSEALKRNAVVTLCMSADGATCAGSGGWEQGWIILGGATTLRAHPAAPPGIKITAGGITSVLFQPTAAGATAATFTLCRATPTVGHEERRVTIDATGRPWVKRTTLGACP
jgi:type IV fimbrial biogenesis protein FimT